jgi:Fur family ferric uptake transcriptional regulator
MMYISSLVFTLNIASTGQAGLHASHFVQASLIACAMILSSFHLELRFGIENSLIIIVVIQSVVNSVKEFILSLNIKIIGYIMVEPIENSVVWERFVDFLRENHLRVTKVRQIIFQAALDKQGHFTADELAAELSSGLKRVSRGSVYRTLSLMKEADFIMALRNDHPHVHYECVYRHRHHEHMVCTVCGMFLEFGDEEIEPFLRKKCLEKGFVPLYHRLTIFGVCEKCSKASSGSNSINGEVAR